MKKIWIALIILFNISSIVYAFSDTTNHWAKEYIEWGSNEEIINGYYDNTFKPDENVKINEFLKMLVEASKYKKEIVGNRWPDWYIATAKKYNWIDENEFSNYEKSITRNEVIRIISKYIDLSDIKKSKTNIIDLDSANKENVLKLINLGVIKGYEDNTFRGDKTITRAETIKIIKEAVNARQKVINDKEYSLNDNAFEYTNTGKDKNTSLYRNRYEVKNNKLYFYDNGRYANLDGYRIDNAYIDENKVIKLLKKLVSEDTYTAVNYVPDKYTINQLVIAHGDREQYIYNGLPRFSFTFYENKLYDLKNVTMQEEFSDNCFLKIKVSKLWLWQDELDNKTYINEYKFERLKACIEVLLGEEETEELMPYIKEKIIEEFENDEKIIDKKEIKKYVINTYTTDNSGVEFYISKK
ncbi:MAG: S-layer homology domain-containing protein [Clostridia bacterium]|nr:S-layer homology domain-containing protein [Clostridia bacterium]